MRAFAAIVVGPDGELKEIVEKPPEPERYVRDGRLWVNMNLFRFTPEIFGSCRSIQPDPDRGELELPSPFFCIRLHHSTCDGIGVIATLGLLSLALEMP